MLASSFGLPNVMGGLLSLYMSPQWGSIAPNHTRKVQTQHHTNHTRKNTRKRTQTPTRTQITHKPHTPRCNLGSSLGEFFLKKRGGVCSLGLGCRVSCKCRMLHSIQKAESRIFQNAKCRYGGCFYFKLQFAIANANQMPMPVSKTANSKQQTANSKQQTTNSKQQTASSKQKQQTAKPVLILTLTPPCGRVSIGCFPAAGRSPPPPPLHFFLGGGGRGSEGGEKGGGRDASSNKKNKRQENRR